MAGEKEVLQVCSRGDSYDRKGQAYRSAAGEKVGLLPASFSICSLRRTKLPIIYPEFRLDYKLATLPHLPPGELLERTFRLFHAAPLGKKRTTLLIDVLL